MSLDCNLLFNETYKSYELNGARSNAKIKVAHSILKRELSVEGSEIFCLTIGEDSKELNFKFSNNYSKNIDIVSLKNKTVNYFAGTKFLFANIKQNLNNYFESELGQAFMLTSTGIPYFSLNFLLDEVPYFNKQGEVLKTEKISKDDLLKYQNLSLIKNCFFSIVVFSFSKNTIVDTIGEDIYKIIERMKEISR